MIYHDTSQYITICNNTSERGTDQRHGKVSKIGKLVVLNADSKSMRKFYNIYMCHTFPFYDIANFNYLKVAHLLIPCQGKLRKFDQFTHGFFHLHSVVLFLKPLVNY